MKQVIFCAAIEGEFRGDTIVSASSLEALSAPCARDIGTGERAPNIARFMPWGRGTDGTNTRKCFKFTQPRTAKARPSHANPCISVNESGGEAVFSPGLVTSALQAVTLTSQGRDAKYIFSSHIPSAPGICAALACNVRQAPPFFPFGNSLSCPVERYFDRAVHIPNITDYPSVGNSLQKTRALFSSNIKGIRAHSETRSAT